MSQIYKITGAEMFALSFKDVKEQGVVLLQPVPARQAWYVGKAGGDGGVPLLNKDSEQTLMENTMCKARHRGLITTTATSYYRNVIRL